MQNLSSRAIVKVCFTVGSVSLTWQPAGGGGAGTVNSLQYFGFGLQHPFETLAVSVTYCSFKKPAQLCLFPPTVSVLCLQYSVFLKGTKVKSVWVLLWLLPLPGSFVTAVYAPSPD